MQDEVLVLCFWLQMGQVKLGKCYQQCEANGYYTLEGITSSKLSVEFLDSTIKTSFV